MSEMRNKSSYTLKELTQGLDVTIQGDPECRIEGVSTIHQAKPNHITFLTNPLYKKYLGDTQAAAVILLEEDASTCPTNAVICRDPYYTYAKIAEYFDRRPKPAPGIHSSAVIGQECQIHPSVSIGPHCTIGNKVILGEGVIIESGCVISDQSEIGNHTHLHANVTLYHQVQIGKYSSVSSGTVIGSDGFGIAKHKGTWHRVPQLGGVTIGDYVDIGANCAIDRGAIDDTIIESGVKLDNLIQIGHNVRICERTAIAANVGISGSTQIGKNCLIGGGAGFAGHLTIADNVVITGGSAITKSIREPGVYSSGVGGVMTNLEWRKNSARVNRLDHLLERVQLLEKIIQDSGSR